MFAIRRNLRKGKQFGWMQIHEASTKSSIKKGSKDIFIDPSKQSIKMHNCYLHNSTSRASKIHAGEIYKERCAWASCESFEIVDRTSLVSEVDAKNVMLAEVSYNPRKSPTWMQDNNNVDKQTFDCLVTFGTQIFINKK